MQPPRVGLHCPYEKCLGFVAPSIRKLSSNALQRFGHALGEQGAVQADVGILVISARKGEFETGFDRGGQTREHALLAKTLGVR